MAGPRVIGERGQPGVLDVTGANVGDPGRGPEPLSECGGEPHDYPPDMAFFMASLLEGDDTRRARGNVIIKGKPVSRAPSTPLLHGMPVEQWTCAGRLHLPAPVLRTGARIGPARPASFLPYPQRLRSRLPCPNATIDSRRRPRAFYVF